MLVLDAAQTLRQINALESKYEDATYLELQMRDLISILASKRTISRKLSHYVTVFTSKTKLDPI